ncbi:MAG: insulinase family protein, partial [Hyphomonadaceae bacterium]|nr:insulinase family protein [Hyphomonadaceae bacterium]
MRRSVFALGKPRAAPRRWRGGESLYPRPEPRVELELVRLPNGVRVALDPMPGLGTAALGVWLRVGARWEPVEHNGIAHLFEHMAFKGAGSRDARQFAEAIENVGGVMNAATGYERTAYYARVVRESAPFALD